MNIPINATVVRGQRSQYDSFFASIANEIMSQAPLGAKAYYIWAEPIEELRSMIEDIDCSGDLVFLFVPDNLTMHEFNPDTDIRTAGVQIILDKAARHPDTTFILVSEVMNLESEIPAESNIKLINIEFLAMSKFDNGEKIGWPNVKPVLEKNLNSEKIYISLNNRPSSHRISSVCYQLSSGIAQYGVVTVSKMFAEHVAKSGSYLNVVPWNFSKNNELTVRPLLIDGFDKINQLLTPNSDVRMNNNYHPPANFNLHLRHRYENSFVELISETYYTEKSFMCTEKILNCIYGLNFPILISSAGIVEHLRKLGFDMFDDIIDHSYDTISDPVDRLAAIFVNNHNILTNSQYVKEVWLKNHSRLVANYEFATYNMYNRIHDRAMSQYDQIAKTLRM